MKRSDSRVSCLLGRLKGFWTVTSAVVIGATMYATLSHGSESRGRTLFDLYGIQDPDEVARKSRIRERVREISQSEPKYDAAWYGECVQRTASAKTDSAAKAIEGVCRTQAVPKRCRGLPSNDQDASIGQNERIIPEEAFSTLARCVVECDRASLLSRRFGDCSKG